MNKDAIHYGLYNNKEQSILHVFASSKEELKEISLQYTEGIWFEYDVEIKEGSSDKLFNERLYKGKVKFASEPLEKEVEEEDKYKFALRSSLGDLR